jgi:RNA polymerase sigma-70 factor (ECF subfamily)
LVRNLSRDHQVVIVLRFWNDYSLQEIAETLGVPVGTVKSRLNHAIGALRKLYEKQSAGTSRMG